MTSNGDEGAGDGRVCACGASARKAGQLDLDMGSAIVFVEPGIHEVRMLMLRLVAMSTAAVSIAPMRGEEEW